MNKRKLTSIVLILMLSFTSAIAFTRVTNDFGHSKLLFEFSKNTNSLIFEYSGDGSNNVDTNKLLEVIDESEVVIYQIMPVNNDKVVYYYNIDEEHLKIIDKYKKSCKKSCFKFIETSFEDFDISQGLTFSTNNYELFKKS